MQNFKPLNKNISSTKDGWKCEKCHFPLTNRYHNKGKTYVINGQQLCWECFRTLCVSYGIDPMKYK